MNENYQIERECNKCSHLQKINVSKREAAFELYDINKILGNVCKKCDGDKFTTKHPAKNIDFALFKEWAINPELYFMDQDEELILADEEHLDLILYTLDNIKIHKHKQDLLMDALCIIVYDNSLPINKSGDFFLRDKVINEINSRLEKLNDANEWIMDYIKEIVYPQLNIKK